MNRMVRKCFRFSRHRCVYFTHALANCHTTRFQVSRCIRRSRILYSYTIYAAVKMAIEQYPCHQVHLGRRRRRRRHHTTEKIMNFIASIAYIPHSLTPLASQPIDCISFTNEYHLNNLPILHVWKSIEFLFARLRMCYVLYCVCMRELCSSMAHEMQLWTLTDHSKDNVLTKIHVIILINYNGISIYNKIVLCTVTIHPGPVPSLRLINIIIFINSPSIFRQVLMRTFTSHKRENIKKKKKMKIPKIKK